MILDIYYSSEFKKSYETNYDFNIPLDINLDVKEDEKLVFKLIDFTMMNNMLTITEQHKNNYFKIIFNGYEYDFYIEDGSYTAVSLKDYINNKFIEEELPLVMNYKKSTNKFSFVVTDNLEFYPYNCNKLFGFTKQSYYSFINTNTYYGDDIANMLPYTKIVISTNLAFETSSQNNFESKYSSNTSIGDIVAWISRDVPLFTTITYTNNQNLEIDISNKNIKTINIMILNEYKEFIKDASTCFINFQIKTKKNVIE